MQALLFYFDGGPPSAQKKEDAFPLFTKALQSTKKGGHFKIQNYFENAARRIIANCRRAGSRHNKRTATTNNARSNKP